MNSKRVKMNYKLLSQTLDSNYDFKIMDRGETLIDIIEEIHSVIGGSFAPFISDASYLIKQNGEIASAIMINHYEGYPLISEIFTNKKYQKLGIASSLIKKSINSLLDMGYENLMLNVDIINIAAINLYRKIGFEIKERNDNTE